MAQKFLTEITLQALNNATTDTDQFLVSDSGTIKFRTGAQVLSDIGGQAALTNPVTGTGTTNYVSKFTGTTTLGNSQIFDNGTNIGIGTTTPQRKLDVISGANNFVSVGISQMSVGQWAGVGFGYAEGANNLYRKAAIVFERTDLTANDAQGKVHILNGPQGNANSATLADSKLTIAENGNVGIGTTNPSYKLDVNGTGRFSSDLLTNNRFVAGSSTNINTRVFASAFSGELSAAVFTTFDNSASTQEAVRFSTADLLTGAVRIYPRVGAGSYNAITVADSTAVVSMTTKPLLIAVQDGSAIQFTATEAIIGTNNSEKVRITSSGDVGIGTSVPAGKLNAIGDIIAGSFTYTTGVNLQNRTAKSLLYISTDGVNNAVGSTITYTWVDGGQGPLKFNNTSGEVMRLDASGKLGVGTTTPTSRIHSVTSASGPVSFDNRAAVYGHNTSTDTIYNNQIGIAGRVVTSGGMAVYGDATTGSGWAGYFNGKGYFSANVGIGTATPSYPLDVNGIAILRNALYMTSGGSSAVPAWSFSINGSGDLVVDESITTQNFIFSNAGQVLIGTTVGGTPTYGSAPQFVTSSSTGGVIDIRNINSTINTGTLLGRLQFTGKSDSSIGYTAAAIDVITSTTAGTGSSGGGILRFMTANAGGGQTPTARMWINQAGYVSIGLTNTASYPLRVTTQVSNISIYADFDIVAFSDQSVKENIRPIENVIERVQKSRGVLYDRTDSGSKDNIGFIAQELEVAFPELVTTNEDGTKAVKYQNAVAVMFEAIKEQQKQIDELKELVNKLIK